MVRRSTVDRSPQPDLYGAGYDPGTESRQAGAGKRPRSGSGWRGAGGRWLVWTFRVMVWAVLLIIGYRGVMAIVLNETPPSHTTPAPATSAPAFPVQEASQVLDYGYVNISGHEFLLPLKSEMRMRHDKYLTKNDTEYRLYRKFSAEAEIIFDTPAPLPEDQTKEQSPK